MIASISSNSRLGVSDQLLYQEKNSPIRYSKHMKCAFVLMECGDLGMGDFNLPLVDIHKEVRVLYDVACNGNTPSHSSQ
jgi:hypothetical protein